MVIQSAGSHKAFSLAQSVRPQSLQRLPQTTTKLVHFGQAPLEKNRLLDSDIYNLIRGLPKVTLHEHLGGSTDMPLYKMNLLAEGERANLDAETLRERLRVARAEQYQKTMNRTDLNDDEVMDAGKNGGLAGYRKKYAENDGIFRAKMIENAYMASYLYTLKAADKHHVRYFELRTNPFPGNGTAEEFIKYIQEGIEDAKSDLNKKRVDIDYGLILLAYRHGDESVNPATGRMVKIDEAIEVAKTAVALKEKGYPISAVDLAGDENLYPVTDFAPFFNIIHEFNARMVAAGTPEKRLGITVHAGETQTSGPLSGSESVRETIRLAWDENTPVRIGHGIQAAKDPALLEEIKAKGIGLEMCPKSNVQTEAVSWYTDHPAVTLSRQGVKVSISPDNQTVSKTDPTNEFVKLHRYNKANHEDRKRMVLSGLETAFIMDPAKKQRVIEEVKATFKHFENKPKMALGIYKELLAHGEKPPMTLNVYKGLQANGQNPSPFIFYPKILLSTLKLWVKQLGQWVSTLFKSDIKPSPVASAATK